MAVSWHPPTLKWNLIWCPKGRSFEWPMFALKLVFRTKHGLTSLWFYVRLFLNQLPVNQRSVLIVIHTSAPGGRPTSGCWSYEPKIGGKLTSQYESQDPTEKKTPFGFLLEAMVANDFDVSIFLNNNDVTWCKFRPLILFLMLLLDVDALKIQLLVSRVKQPIKSINNVWEICQVQGIIRGHDFLQLTSNSWKLVGLSQNEPVALIRPAGVFWACEGFLREDMELLPKKQTTWETLCQGTMRCPWHVGHLSDLQRGFDRKHHIESALGLIFQHQVKLKCIYPEQRAAPACNPTFWKAWRHVSTFTLRNIIRISASWALWM